MHQLNVYHEKQFVGTVGYTGETDHYTFEYDEQWKEDGFELSPPLDFDKHVSSHTIKNFIENLLPEGVPLQQLITKNNLSKNNFFAILSAIGIETTGALSFAPVGIDSFEETSFRTITHEELASRISERKSVPISVWDKKPRISVAGVQEKLPIAMIDGKMGFGEGSLASTHILKFSNQHEDLVFNEYVSLRLAEKAGISVAQAELLTFGEEPVLCVTRFDRALSEQKVKRGHIVDACQALDLPVSYKYEQNFGSRRDVKDIREGVSLEKLFSLIKLCDSPIVAKKQLLNWVCVNLCLGNSDAHGKNISFMIEKDSFRVAPFYDIVNISLYQEQYDNGLAMAIDDEFSIGALTVYDLREFCQSIDINKKLFTSEFTKISILILAALESSEIKEEVEAHEQATFFESYTLDVITRVTKLMTVVREL